MKDRQIKTIADHYGLDHQLGKTLEELRELTDAVTDYCRWPSGVAALHLAEEIADVENMLEQLKYLADVKAMVKGCRLSKIRRQLHRIAAGVD